MSPGNSRGAAAVRDAREAGSNAPAVDDWREVLDRLLIGDRHAFVALDRLVTGVLTQLRAYDYRDEWDGVRQVVLAALVANARAGRLPDSQAVAGYVQILTRQKMVEELKSSLRQPAPALAPAPAAPTLAAHGTAPTPAREVWNAVAGLSADHRDAVRGVYGYGKTYQAMSEEIGIPIAAVTRRLREAFSSLRRRLSGSSETDG